MNGNDASRVRLQVTLTSGSWTHSFEEDEPGDVLVYRPTHSFAFPPTRAGRDTIVFGEGGELTEHAPGPDDRPRDTARSLDGARHESLHARRHGGGPRAESIEIIEASADDSQDSQALKPINLSRLSVMIEFIVVSSCGDATGD